MQLVRGVDKAALGLQLMRMLQSLKLKMFALLVLFVICPATARAQMGLDPLAPWPDGENDNELWMKIAAGAEVCVVQRVVDGDTLDVLCGAKPVVVRLHAVDAPEIHGHQKCAAEGTRGFEAFKFAEQWAPVGWRVSIWFVAKPDRYGRRVGMVTLKGRDLGSDLVMKGLAKPWGWGEPKPNWCE